jgi:hypothetical protein
MGPLTDGQMRHASAARGAGLTLFLMPFTAACLSTFRQAVSRFGKSTSDEGVVIVVMALLSFADFDTRA